MKKIFFNNWKSLGDKENKKVSELVLEYSKNNQGLLILTGENNSGKSNVLSALSVLEEFGNKEKIHCCYDSYNMNENDEVYFYYFEEDDNYKYFQFVYCDKNKGPIDNHYLKKQLFSFKKQINYFESKNVEKLIRYARDLISHYKYDLKTIHFYLNNIFIKIFKKIINNEKIIVNDFVEYMKLELFIEEISKKLSLEEKNKFINPSYHSGYENNKTLCLKNPIKFEYDSSITNNLIINANEIKKYNDNEKTNTLIKILNSYDQNIIEEISYYFQLSDIDNLIKITEKINNYLNDFSNKINEIVGTNKKYLFKCNYLKTRKNIELKLRSIYGKKREIYEDINTQSLGFKWLFSLLVYLITIKTNDQRQIIYMDEPATNLNGLILKNLRESLKKIGKNNNILFVLSTHSSFWINIRNLEEIRVIRKNDYGSEIHNYFEFFFKKNTQDSIEMLSKLLLTTKESLLENEYTQLIYVEGHSDVLYLTGMANRLIKKTNNDIYKKLIFVPINGLGRDEVDVEDITELSKSVRNPLLLIDGDEKANEFELAVKLFNVKGSENAKVNHIKLIKLSDINKKWKEIEKVFKDKLPNNNKSPEIALNTKEEIEDINNKKFEKSEKEFKKILDILVLM
ncbi:AAA family ATPase [Mycoplasmopsis lipofaciens]|uniref:AAA family ATPase n=1 Tax=Mycoplasmopsis lipofaciens TaxID=114884 RepID=UPI0004848653|nr:AAA family ATPase [Mycoplasmopsis lipofaciens]